jgi:DNA-binding CsgD family transcriptional regulator
MAFSQLEIEQTAARIGAAAFDPDLWPMVLQDFRRAGGGWGGQLAGVMPGRGLAFDFCDGVPEDVRADFAVLGGADPKINPRARVFLKAAPGQVVSDLDLMTEAERRASPFFNDFFLRHDSAHICMVRIAGPGGLRVIVSALRSARQGEAGEAERRALAALVAPVQAALRLQHTLEAQGPVMTAGALEALGVPAFVCNAWGRVIATTAGAEVEVAQGIVLRLVQGRLEALDRLSDEALQTAIRLTALGGVPAPVVLHGAQGAPVIADVAGLPLHAYSLRAGAVCVVALRRRRESPDTTDLLCSAFRLTRSEAAIALALVAGSHPAEIAEARRAALHTVRTQIKSLMGKIGVQSQLALAAVVHDFLEGGHG